MVVTFCVSCAHRRKFWVVYGFLIFLLWVFGSAGKKNIIYFCSCFSGQVTIRCHGMYHPNPTATLAHYFSDINTFGIYASTVSFLSVLVCVTLLLHIACKYDIHTKRSSFLMILKNLVVWFVSSGFEFFLAFLNFLHTVLSSCAAIYFPSA